MQGKLVSGRPQVWRRARASGITTTGNLKRNLAAALAAIFFGWVAVGCGGGAKSSQTPPLTTTTQAANPPTVAISAPANGASLPAGAVHVVASANGDAAISSLVIMLDGNQVFSAGAASVDTSIAAAAGSHTLIVQVTDAQGHTAQASVQFTVAGQAQVSATIASPAEGSTALSPVHVVANASGTNPIASLQLMLDGKSAGSFTRGSVDTTLTTVPGKHTLFLQASDDHGTTATQTVHFSVSAPHFVFVALDGTTDPSDGYFPFNGVIAGYALDPATGAFASTTPITTVAGGGSFSQPFELLTDKAGSFLLGADTDDRNGPGQMQLMAINNSSGKVQQSDFAYVESPSATALTLGPGDRFLYSGGQPCDAQANCSNLNGILAWQINNGFLTSLAGAPFGASDMIAGVASLAYEGKRQLLFVGDTHGTATNTVATEILTYKLDPATGIPAFKSKKTVASGGQVGPALPNGKFLYFLSGTSATAFSMASSGSITQVSSTQLQASRLFADRSSRFLFALPSDGSATISLYAIDPNTGALTLASTATLTAAATWVSFDASGQLVYVSNGSAISVFNFDPQSGGLAEVAGSPFIVGTTDNPTASVSATSTLQ